MGDLFNANKYNEGHYESWKDTLGNNFTGNNGIHNSMMQNKNWQTQGGYQAEVSGMYGEFTVAAVFKALPDEYAILNDVLIQTGIQYRRYTYDDYLKYGESPWDLVIKRGKNIQQINKQQALAIMKGNTNTVYYEQVKQSSQLDHIIVSPYGIFVIETKNHKGMIFGDMNGKVWTETFLSTHHTFYNPVLQNEQHLRYLSKYMGIGRQYMVGLIVFTNPQADLSHVNCPFCLTVPQLQQAIESYDRAIWDEEQKLAVIKRIEKINSSSYTLSKEHVTFVKDLQHRQEVNKAYKRRSYV